MKNINAIVENAILVTSGVVCFYSSIPHGLETLRETLDKTKHVKYLQVN